MRLKRAMDEHAPNTQANGCAGMLDSAKHGDDRMRNDWGHH
ncbi:hypothetical protein [Rhizobium sp. ARZ01]|nr:hypothetical protein [Rhizobium sp. ARZ01]